MMNTYLAKFYDWCNYNKLAINVKKTKWMLFSNRKTDVPPLMLDAAEIERVKKFKYLGFLIDDRLTHRFHVKCLISSLALYAFVSWKIRPYLGAESAKTFYYGLVHSRVCYGLLVWGGVFLEGVNYI
jgi:hypothetical protein